jgi:hypothetical protein
MDRKQSKSMPSFFDVVDSQGEVITSTQLDPLPDPVRNPSLSQWLSHRFHSPALFFGEMAYRKAGALLGSTRLANALKSQWGERWPETRERMIWILGLSSLCAALACLLGCRAHLGGRSLLAWTAFVFVFNLAGLLVFRMLVDWPSQVPCPDCTRKRPVSKPFCPHCRQKWASGMDIMDHQPSPARPA